MNRFRSTVLLLLLTTLSFAQVKTPYAIYDSKGKKVSYKKMMSKISKSDMLLFGEEHNNSIAHWLQLEVTKELMQKRKLTLGAEMFEADNQEVINQYLSKKINEEQLDSLARLWPNFKTDYKPLLDLARDSGLVFIASNVPRKYASKVYKGGFEKLDSISEQEKKWIAPLPIDFDANLSQYVEMKKMMNGHGGDNIAKSQAIKDATMAYFILQNYKPGNLFIHYHGTFHSDMHQGILWYLQKKQANLNYITISTVTQKDIEKLDKENLGKGDFIICVDEDMTTTY